MPARMPPPLLNSEPVVQSTSGTAVQNYVSVTVSYQWRPEGFSSVFGTRTLTSTSTVPMQY